MSYPARPLLYAIADYLASAEHAGQSDKVREQLQAAATLVAGAGEFDLSSANDRASLGRCTPQDFAAAFHATHEGASAGANPVAGEASAASSNSVESSEEFQAFLQKVTSKGYFGSSEKGSPEYETKYRRALEKFTAKLSSRTAQKEAKEAAAKQKQQVSEEQALAKKTEGNSKLKAGGA